MSILSKILGRDSDQDDTSEEDSSEDEKETPNLTFDVLRVQPPQEERDINPKTDRLTDLLVVLFIFSIAFWFRFYFRMRFIGTYGNDEFHLTLVKSDPLRFGEWLGLEPGDSTASEGYSDYDTYYIPYVDNFSDGWNPYSGHRTPGDDIAGYVYGPYYIISIALGKMMFGMSTTDSIIFSNIIFDSLCFVMVYILAKRVTGNIIAMVFALISSFSPISLYYITYKGLNAPIMNFSFLVFIWAYLEKRDNLAAILLAFSTLTKQFPLFFALPFGFWMFRRYGFLKGASYILLYILSVIMLSVPYILTIPGSYIVRLFLPGGGKSSIHCPAGGEATNLFHGMLDVDTCNKVGSGPLPQNLIPEFGGLMHGLVNGHIIFFGSVIILGWLAFTAYDYFEEQPRLYFVYFAAFYGIVHATIARGIYKYYLTFVIPLFVLGLITGDRSKSAHIRLGAMIRWNIRDWIHPRYRKRDPSVSYWIYGIVILLSIVGTIWLIFAAISMFAPNQRIFNLLAIIIIPLILITLIKAHPGKLKPKEEFIPIKNSWKAFSFLPVFIAVAIIGLFPLAEMYFNQDDRLWWNAGIMIGILVLFLVMPVLNIIVTKRNYTFQFFNADIEQTISDISLFGLAFLLLNYFHRTIFLIHRFYTTSFVLAFSFVFLALLGKQVWYSTVKIPIRAYKRYKSLRGHVNSTDVNK